MLDIDKIYTKEEFKKLLKSKESFLIVDYYKTDKNEFLDYYVSDLHKLSKEEQLMIDNDKLEIFRTLKADDLIKINNISYDVINGATKFKDINLDVINTIIENNNYLKDKKKDYNFGLMFGYWLGIQALSSYILRLNDIERNNNIDDVINANASLF